MTSPYKIWPGLKSHALGRHALALREAYGKPCRLSPLIAMSDPLRTPYVLDWAQNLPDHCAVVYRFETRDENIVEGLKQLTAQKHQQLLLRQDSPENDIQGLHFKRHTSFDIIKRIRAENSEQLLTLAAIKSGSYQESLPNLNGLFVSAIFPSKSPSAGMPIGVGALKQRVKEYEKPVFALGGVNAQTAPKLMGTGIAGIAAVGALSSKGL